MCPDLCPFITRLCVLIFARLSPVCVLIFARLSPVCLSRSSPVCHPSVCPDFARLSPVCLSRSSPVCHLSVSRSQPSVTRLFVPMFVPIFARLSPVCLSRFSPVCHPSVCPDLRPFVTCLCPDPSQVAAAERPGDAPPSRV